MGRQRLTQLFLVLVAAGLLAAAGLLQSPLDRLSEKHNLVDPGDVVAQRNPQLTLLTTVFGGLKAPIVSFLWIRAEQQKQEGRHFDALQSAELICELMPGFPEVWAFHAWNMAWNISVQTHTPEERWLWVTNGVRLLRDRAIPRFRRSPRALVLYKELAWIFYSKIAGTSDDMHMEYKKRWVAEMQALLGAPPVGTTQEVIAAFRPIADEALLDRDPRRQGRDEIQPDKFAQLLENQTVRGCLEGLQTRFAEGDQKLKSQPLIEFANRHLLDLYNRYSLDEGVDAARLRPLAPADLKTPKDSNLFDWINSPGLAAYLQRLLNFVRAQKLWNVYRMDPKWMLTLMEKYEVPLDWRHPLAQGLYWNSYGLKVCKGLVTVDEIDSLNTNRTLSFCLRDMVFFGRIIYRLGQEGVEPAFMGDLRFIDPAQKLYREMIGEVRAARGESFKDNVLGDGHVNFLIAAIQMLYAAGYRTRAEGYLKWVVDNYQRTGKDWDFYVVVGENRYLDVDAFVRYHMEKDFAEGLPAEDFVTGQITGAVRAAFQSLIHGMDNDYVQYLAYAKFAHGVYNRQAPKRMRKYLGPFDEYVKAILSLMLVRPEALDIDAQLDTGAGTRRLGLTDRMSLYERVGRGTEGNKWLAAIYDRIAPALRRLCAEENRSFEAAFPPPAGLKEYRDRSRQRSP